jgi:hypothetical protein
VSLQKHLLERLETLVKVSQHEKTQPTDNPSRWTKIGYKMRRLAYELESAAAV